MVCSKLKNNLELEYTFYFYFLFGHLTFAEMLE